MPKVRKNPQKKPKKKPKKKPQKKDSIAAYCDGCAPSHLPWIPRDLVNQEDEHVTDTCWCVSSLGAIDTKLAHESRQKHIHDRFCHFDLRRLVHPLILSSNNLSIVLALWGAVRKSAVAAAESASAADPDDDDIPPPLQPFPRSLTTPGIKPLIRRPFNLSFKKNRYLDNYLEYKSGHPSLLDPLMSHPGVVTVYHPKGTRDWWIGYQVARYNANPSQKLPSPDLHSMLAVALNPNDGYLVAQDCNGPDSGYMGYIKMRISHIWDMWYPTSLSNSPSTRVHEWIGKFQKYLAKSFDEFNGKMKLLQVKFAWLKGWVEWAELRMKDGSLGMSGDERTNVLSAKTTLSNISKRKVRNVFKRFGAISSIVIQGNRFWVSFKTAVSAQNAFGLHLHGLCLPYRGMIRRRLNM